MILSVIIPTLNEEEYIIDLLDCLADQTYKDFEVIVVDGDSEDKTRKIVSSYKKLKNLHLINAKSKGVGMQRNLGAKNAITDKLIFLDADGYIEKDFIVKITSFISNNPEVDIMTTWLEPISNKKVDKILFFTFNQFYLDIMKRIKPQGTGAFMYIKRKVFEDLNGFNEKFSVAEDMDMCVRAHKEGYKYHLLKRPRIKTSVRRLEKLGRLRYVWIMGKNAVYMHFVGPFDKNKFTGYVMDHGGAMYKGIKKRIK
ncbi:hypothetical protein A2V49_03850 [candidate division WWE3 bacterium RBG_19FT_COMBO_34_6]|uniref:Glycosyltransferase 2-like domain-containing protein n=1 Tax=candidate division WWE3 bacterium RBG_19FT_COMBO_34_6 TaxID=1802612 RepID=A0A1F4UL18_UNCKA|nr:MAG: hypothetical protein A2V49_03850 [candidate division WWE3 bacterium RBG_19FT_COMBO_34_6]